MKASELANDLNRETYGIKSVSYARGLVDTSSDGEIWQHFRETGDVFLAVRLSGGFEPFEVDTYAHLKRLDNGDGTVTDYYGPRR